MNIPHEAVWGRNPYGYLLNINHPAVYPLYMRYKRWKEIPVWCPMSDKERIEFENYLAAPKGESDAKSQEKQTAGTGD